MALVDDAELRIALAQKHKCHDIVINVRTLGVCLNFSDWPIFLTVCLFAIFLDQSDVPRP